MKQPIMLRNHILLVYIYNTDWVTIGEEMSAFVVIIIILEKIHD